MYIFKVSLEGEISKSTIMNNLSIYLKLKLILFYCIFKVSLEGEISKSTIMNSLSRGKRASGDLIPWTISQQVNI